MSRDEAEPAAGQPLLLLGPLRQAARLVEVVERSRAILGIPADWRVAIVAGSDTGAMEIAMWSLLGARGVDMLAWENFGEGWVADVVQLKLADVRVMRVPYGQLPDLSQV